MHLGQRIRVRVIPPILIRSNVSRTNVNISRWAKIRDTRDLRSFSIFFARGDYLNIHLRVILISWSTVGSSSGARLSLSLSLSARYAKRVDLKKTCWRRLWRKWFSTCTSADHCWINWRAGFVGEIIRRVGALCNPTRYKAMSLARLFKRRNVLTAFQHCAFVVTELSSRN